ncbi:chorismate lyase [Aestuariirhabdus sp. Z084]|uniref:chorismate--pyruvate lyase family protein n=1 Tax=Aestuariirhabdus haliotis TaxID=2918751 RepID=UPI00201B377D|nr:chorismate lyase [Aestuariirhabdus haliotis]MCL6414317.1 chorismate lyase [Aestuariirhabdus haliotis]MCL6418249.1 chorismate lyase [Aestuariirhabdus haliotis]
MSSLIGIRLPLTTLYANQWRPQSHILTSDLPEPWRSWLLDRGSLTQRLMRRYPGGFEVQLIRQRWARPTPSERHCLDIGQREMANIREVLLMGDGVPRVFARSVLPHSTLIGANRCLLHLKNKPLGAFLFGNPAMERGEIEIAPLPVSQLNAHLPHRYDEQIGWGRRSLFYLGHRPLSVCEVFLPSLFE